MRFLCADLRIISSLFRLACLAVLIEADASCKPLDNIEVMTEFIELMRTSVFSSVGDVVRDVFCSRLLTSKAYDCLL